MKKILIALAATGFLATAGMAVAQPHPQDRPGQSHGPSKPAAKPTPPKKPQAQSANWDRQSDRKGSRWDRHVRSCKAKYRSYSPQRDAYRNNRGQWVRCRL